MEAGFVLISEVCMAAKLVLLMTGN